MYMIHEPVEAYWKKWNAFDELARAMALTPADRHFAWVEHTKDEDWNEWPVPVEHFVTDPYYVGTSILVRPVVKEFITDFADPAAGYELFVFIGGIGAGKSFSASLLMMYTLYQLSCLKKPQRYLNGFPGVSLSGDAEIALMNASGAGAAQAGKIVYSEIYEKVQKSPYFKQNFEPYPNKGLDCNTLLPTPTGFVRMGDVEAGDTLIGGDGRPTTVVEAYNPREIACYRITFVDGTEVVADAEHRWRVRDRMGRKWKVLETSELVAGRHGVPAPPFVELPERSLLIEPYAFGVWLGDGTSSGAGLTCAEEEVLEHLAAVGEPARSLDRPYAYTWAGTRAGPRQGKFVTRLRELGVLDNKHIPIDYLRASSQQRLSLLQGLMDTDGHATKRDGGCIFVSTKEELARDCHSLVRSLGIRATLREGRAMLDGIDKGPCWRVSFVTDLPVFRLERKQAVLRDRPRKIRDAVGIRKIERVETRPTRCLRVDSHEHTYLFGREMLVTHNSSELDFPNRIRLTPGTSQWKSALGYNMFAFVVDEAAFGTENDRTDSVKELFGAFNQRRRSRFGRCGWGGLFTSPGSEQGFVEIIAGEGDEWDATILVSRTTTWEAKDELKPGARVFLLDRHPDSVRILESDLIFVGHDPDTGLPICQRQDGEVVRVRNQTVEDEVVPTLSTDAPR